MCGEEEVSRGRTKRVRVTHRRMLARKGHPSTNQPASQPGPGAGPGRVQCGAVRGDADAMGGDSESVPSAALRCSNFAATEAKKGFSLRDRQSGCVLTSLSLSLSIETEVEFGSFLVCVRPKKKWVHEFSTRSLQPRQKAVPKVEQKAQPSRFTRVLRDKHRFGLKNPASAVRFCQSSQLRWSRTTPIRGASSLLKLAQLLGIIYSTPRPRSKQALHHFRLAFLCSFVPA